MVVSRKRRVTLEPRAARSDGTAKRDHILQIAARIFAKKGFDRTTSKAICLAAGTNTAAVNYHFGSRDALYVAVLIEAHGQLINRATLESIADSHTSPVQKLRALLSQFLIRPAASETPWGLQVLIREMMVPSDHLPPLVRKAVLPKIRVMLRIIASVLEVSIDDPLVQRALAFVIFPCIMMVIVPREILRKGLPALEAHPDVWLDDMVDYAVAGLAALAQRNRAAKR
jgi:TetR/AcrR family transcriptional regulator, regulator of cefoperazone and chloramphenicol sensitivity